jgi:hypothetical protein
MQRLLFIIIALIIVLKTLTYQYQQSMPNKAFETSYKAYKYAYDHGYTKKTIFAYVDWTLPSTQKRFFIYDTTLNTTVYSSYVAHGTGSGMGVYPTSFSNNNDSKATSLGVQVTKEFYIGKHGRVLRVEGLEPLNNNVYSRYIEVHGADYIGNGKTGHSWGCYAVPNSDIKNILQTLGTGTIIVSYYPDSQWLETSKFLSN